VSLCGSVAKTINNLARSALNTPSIMRLLQFTIICFFLTLLSGCGILDFGMKTVELAGDTVVFAGKVVVTTVKTTGSVLMTTGRVAGAGIRYFSGKRTVKLEKVGNSYFIEAVINGKHKARLMLDTGATSVLISPDFANKIGLKLSGCGGMSSTLADGSSVLSQSTILDKVKVGSVSVEKVSAHVIGTSNVQHYDGLLGMSFLNNFIFTIDTENNLLILKHKA
jgi:clan AA aspartic protease (TIGR02281 family)